MVFVSFAFSFFARDEGLKEASVWQQRFEALSHKARELENHLHFAEKRALESEQRLAEVTAKLADRDRLLNRLLNDPALASLSASELSVVPKKKIDELTAELANQRAIVSDQQNQLGRLSQALKSEGKGSGYPRCAVTSGFLFEITLLADGRLAVQPAWNPGAASQALAVPGVTGLVNRKTVTIQEFQDFAREILHWSETQPVECRFFVRTKRQTADLTTYLAQMKTIDGFFYPTR